MNRPTWAVITWTVAGFIASVIGHFLFDIEALSWPELAGMCLFNVGILIFVFGSMELWRRQSGDDA